MGAAGVGAFFAANKSASSSSSSSKRLFFALAPPAFWGAFLEAGTSFAGTTSGSSPNNESDLLPGRDVVTVCATLGGSDTITGTTGASSKSSSSSSLNKSFFVLDASGGAFLSTAIGSITIIASFTTGDTFTATPAPGASVATAVAVSFSFFAKLGSIGVKFPNMETAPGGSFFFGFSSSCTKHSKWS